MKIRVCFNGGYYVADTYLGRPSTKNATGITFDVKSSYYRRVYQDNKGLYAILSGKRSPVKLIIS